MSTINKVMLLGRLGRDPVITHTADGATICRLSIATSRRWKHKETDQWQEDVEWHRVVLFGRQAEVAEMYLAKGGQVHIEGYLKTRKWQDKYGVDRYTTEIMGERLTLLGKADDGGFETAKPTKHDQQKANGYAPQPSNLDDDIPF